MWKWLDTEKGFRTFIIVSIGVVLALAGYSFAKSQEATEHVEKQNAALIAQAHQQAIDRENAVLKNVEARKSDCENGNKVREALRENVLQGEKNTPLLLRLVPSLNTKEVLEITAKRDKKQLEEYAPLNCIEYSHKALPNAEKVKVTLEQEQAELKQTQAELAAIVKKSAQTRIVTVKQRCELTRLLAEAHLARSVRGQLMHSLAGCEKQLHEVEKIAAGA